MHKSGVIKLLYLHFVREKAKTDAQNRWVIVYCLRHCHCYADPCSQLPCRYIVQQPRFATLSMMSPTSCYCTKPLTPVSLNQDPEPDPVDATVYLEPQLLFMKRLGLKFISRRNSLVEPPSKAPPRYHARAPSESLVDVQLLHLPPISERPARYSYYELRDNGREHGREQGRLLRRNNHQPLRRSMLGRIVVSASKQSLVQPESPTLDEGRRKSLHSRNSLLSMELTEQASLLDVHSIESVSLIGSFDEELTAPAKANNTTLSTISMSTLAIDQLAVPPRNPSRPGAHPLMEAMKLIHSKASIMDALSFECYNPVDILEAEDDDEERGDLKIKLFVYDRRPSIYRIKVSRKRLNNCHDFLTMILYKLMQKRQVLLNVERIKIAIFFKDVGLPQVVVKDPDVQASGALEMLHDDLVTDFIRTKEKINVRVTYQPKYVPLLPHEAQAMAVPTA